MLSPTTSTNPKKHGGGGAMMGVALFWRSMILLAAIACGVVGVVVVVMVAASIMTTTMTATTTGTATRTTASIITWDETTSTTRVAATAQEVVEEQKYEYVVDVDEVPPRRHPSLYHGRRLLEQESSEHDKQSQQAPQPQPQAPSLVDSLSSSSSSSSSSFSSTTTVTTTTVTTTTATTQKERQCTSPEFLSSQAGEFNNNNNNMKKTAKNNMNWCRNPNDNKENSDDDWESTTPHERQLHELANTLQKNFADQCRNQLVVFGAAFGKKYLNFIWTQQWSKDMHDAKLSQWMHQYQEQQEQAQQAEAEALALVNATNITTNITASSALPPPPPPKSASSSCHFLFVLDDTMHAMPTHRYSRTKLEYEQSSSTDALLWPDPVSWIRTQGQHIVVVRTSDLPFAHARRNIKWLKFQPHRLFPWAQRVMWVDAKLQLPPSLRFSGLERYYQKTIGNSNSRSSDNTNGVCGAVVSLPLHTSTMALLPFITKTTTTKKPTKTGPVPLSTLLPTVRFASHCQAIRQASIHRPDVSDSLHSVLTQCEYYLHQVAGYEFQPPKNSSSTSTSTTASTTTTTNPTTNTTTTPIFTDPWQSSPLVAPALDSTLIDSAILAWDLRTDRCRDFVAQLLCTWLQEIACFSDRDQLSFGYALQQQQQQQQQSSLQQQQTQQQQQQQQSSQQPQLQSQPSLTSGGKGGGGLGGLALVWQHELESLQQQQQQQSQEQQSQQQPEQPVSTTTKPQSLLFPETAHRILVDAHTQLPYLFFVKSKCHWYYGKTALFGCDYSSKNSRNSRGRNN